MGADEDSDHGTAASTGGPSSIERSSPVSSPVADEPNLEHWFRPGLRSYLRSRNEISWSGSAKPTSGGSSGQRPSSAVPTRVHPSHRGVRSAGPTRAHSSDRSVGSAVATRAYDKWNWFGVLVFWGFLLCILALAFSLGILSSAIDVLYTIILAVTVAIIWFRTFGLPVYVLLYSTAFVLLIVPVFRLLIRGRLLGKSLYVSFLISLILLSLLLCGILSVKYSMPEVVFRYKMWKLLDFCLGTPKAIELADHFRKIMPFLAPCNPFLKDAVVSSTQKSQFIARRADWALSRDDKMHEIEAITLGEPRACSYSFKIGSGEISVDGFQKNENNFKFKSTARERLLEEFVAITDWDRIATIFSILRYWEKSPDLGVIENLYVVDGDDIYCHCLSLQSIVEGVCKSPEEFSLFELSKPRRFYVGSSPKRKREDKNPISVRQRLSNFIVVLISILLGAKKSSNVVVGLCIGLSLASFLFIDGLISDFPLKLFVHWVLSHLSSKSWRDRFYLWLKRKGCFLAFCDDFNPVLHHADEHSQELITLGNCIPSTSFAERVPELDWRKIGVNVEQFSTWRWTGTRFVPEPPTTRADVRFTIVRSLFDSDLQPEFEWHQGRWRYFELTLSGRRVRARSELCDVNDDEIEGFMQPGPSNVWYTQLQLDNDPVEHLEWKEPSYLLFVYLMVMWKGRRFGVISGFRRFLFANYYHIFSTYELARQIRDNEAKNSNMAYSYYVLIDEPQPTDMVAGYIHCKDVGIARSEPM